MIESLDNFGLPTIAYLVLPYIDIYNIYPKSVYWFYQLFQKSAKGSIFKGWIDLCTKIIENACGTKMVRIL